MQSAILALVDGEPQRMPIESQLTGDYPAIEANATQYLDGKTIYHGNAADHIETPAQEVTVRESGISTSQTKHFETVACKWYADFEAGFIGVDTSDGDWLFQYLAAKHGVEVFETVVDLDAFAEQIAENVHARAWEVSRKRSYDDDDEMEKVEINYHDSANLAETARGGNIKLGFEYNWDGTIVRGTVSKSGYVAIYSSMTTATFGRWMHDELVDHLTIPESGSQAFLKEIQDREEADA